MGLDSVRLVLDIEKAFDIEIPDGDAAQILTIGDLHRFVLDRLEHRGTPLTPEDVYERLVAVVVESAGVLPEQVTPEARIVDDLGID